MQELNQKIKEINHKYKAVSVYIGQLVLPHLHTLKLTEEEEKIKERLILHLFKCNEAAIKAFLEKERKMELAKEFSDFEKVMDTYNELLTFFKDGSNTNT